MSAIIPAYWNFFQLKITETIDTNPTLAKTLLFSAFLYTTFALGHLTNAYLLPILQKILQRNPSNPKKADVLTVFCNLTPELLLNLFSYVTLKPVIIAFSFSALITSSLTGFVVFLLVASLISTCKNYSSFTLKSPIVLILTLLYILSMFWIDQISIPGVTLLLLIWPICNYFTRKSSNKNDNPKFFDDEPEIDNAFAKLPRNEIPKSETGMRYTIFQRKNSDITDLFPKSYYHSDDLSDISEESRLIQDSKIGASLRENPNYFPQDHIFKTHNKNQDFILNIFENFLPSLTKPADYLFKNTISINKSPLLGLSITMIYCCLSLKLIIFSASIFAKESNAVYILMIALFYPLARIAGNLNRMIKDIQETEDLGETLSEYLKLQGLYLQFGFGVPVIIISLLEKMIIVNSVLLNVIKVTVVATSIILILVFAFRNRSIGISASLAFIVYIFLIDTLLFIN